MIVGIHGVDERNNRAHDVARVRTDLWRDRAKRVEQSIRNMKAAKYWNRRKPKLV